MTWLQETSETAFNTLTIQTLQVTLYQHVIYENKDKTKWEMLHPW